MKCHSLIYIVDRIPRKKFHL